MPVPEAAAAVDGWRERTCDDRPSAGVPAHVTLLFPFLAPAEIDGATIERLRRITATIAIFRIRLARTARFDAVLYLAPEPAGPFVKLTEEIARAFPGHPPYGGAVQEIVPHLTVARGDAALMDEAEADINLLLPIEATLREAVLLEEAVPDWGRWEVRAKLPFG